MAAKASIRQSGDTAPATTAPASAPAGDIVVKDARGRSIGLRRTLGILPQMRLLKMIGHHNSAYRSLCGLIVMVASIDGEAVVLPNSEREIEMLAERLGNEGVDAINAALSAQVGDDVDEGEAAKN
jgi:hypothetical protein